MTLWELFLESCEETKFKEMPGELKFNCTVERNAEPKLAFSG